MNDSRLASLPVRLLLLVFLCSVIPLQASAAEDVVFDDSQLTVPLENPPWFKLSFLDIREDITELKPGKSGLILYFGQDNCPYCKALLEVNFGKRDIVTYTQKYFDVVGIDVRGGRMITGQNGKAQTEKQFSIERNAVFTPTMLFYDRRGEEVFRLVGYYPPYTFRAALEYAADAHYRKESFRDFLSRAEKLDQDQGKGMTKRSFFLGPPYNLARNTIKAQKPLIVFFEQGECHACDVLHNGALRDKNVLQQLNDFDLVQLDMWSDMPIITPQGKKMSIKAWAEKLGVFYTPTLIFYDESGNEIIRIGSVVYFNRLVNVLKYVQEKAYTQYKNIMDWNNRAR